MKAALSRWPMHLAAGEQVQVQMQHGLAAKVVTVDDQTITVFGKSLRLGIAGGGEHQLADEGGIRLLECVQRADRSTRDEQDMGRRLRIDIAEGKYFVVLVDDIRRSSDE